MGRVEHARTALSSFAGRMIIGHLAKIAAMTFIAKAPDTAVVERTAPAVEEAARSA